jgi:hypothetical protein
MNFHPESGQVGDLWGSEFRSPDGSDESANSIGRFVELDGDKVGPYADAPIDAPTVHGFVSMLREGMERATFEDIRAAAGIERGHDQSEGPAS